MPKKGRKAGGKSGDSCIMPFHFINTTALSGGGILTFILSPNASVSPRALIEADTWAHFRVRSFSFRIHPSGTLGPLVAGFQGGIQDTLPATIAQVSELLPSTVLGTAATVPSEWVRVSKEELAGPLPWYKTIPGTADATEESPGIVCLSGGASEALVLEMRGTFEFKTAVSALNTPMFANMRMRLREERARVTFASERDLLLKILGTVPSPPRSLP